MTRLVSKLIIIINEVLKILPTNVDIVADGSLSDTAVGLQGLDSSHRSSKDRSPKSETPTRERERFVISGMGKKSNSTSQLSATGMLAFIEFGFNKSNPFCVSDRLPLLSMISFIP